MPTVQEIEQRLFQLAPRESAMDWDNVGHLLALQSKRSLVFWWHWISQRLWPMRQSLKGVS